MDLEGLIEAISFVRVSSAIHEGLEHCAVLLEKTAKNEIGSYQPEAGPFPAWAPLADSTMREKTRLGFTGRISADDPLFRTGEMRDSIEHRTGHFETVIGTDDPVAEYQEFGTEKIPARPFLGPALYLNKEKIEEILGAFSASAMVPEGLGESWKEDVRSIMSEEDGHDAGV